MTERLKAMMDREADQEFAPVDLEAVVGAGDRTVRRRRVAAGAAGGVTLALVVSAALAFDGGDDSKAGFVDEPFGSSVPVWTEGATLHSPGHTFDLGVQVLTLVRTADGVAFVGEDMGVYAFAGRQPERIGTVARSTARNLVSDPDGDFLGWIDNSRGHPEFVVHDLSTGEQHRYGQHTGDPEAGDVPIDAYFLAIDGTTAYWLDERGMVATDLVTGDARTSAAGRGPTFVVDVEAGLTVNWVEGEDGSDLGSNVVDENGRVLLSYRDVGAVGALSPDGRWVAGMEEAVVWDVRTGQQYRLQTGSDEDAIVYEWLDGSSLVVVTSFDDDEVGLLRCEVPSATCEEVARLNASDQPVALPAWGMFPELAISGSLTEESEQTVETTATAVPQTSATEPHE